MKTKFISAVILSLFLFQSIFAGNDTVGVSVLYSKNSYVPGDTAVIALNLSIPKGYHFYANPLGPGVGTPVTLTPKKGESISWISAREQKPEKSIPEGMEDLWAWAWEKEATLFVSTVIAPTATGTVTSEITIDGLYCSTSCLPFNKTVPLTFTIGDGSGKPFESDSKVAAILASSQEMPLEGITSEPVVEKSAQESVVAENAVVEQIPAWNYQPRAAEKPLNLGLAILFAFIAGIILNFMPCVLPVLGIKILSFSKGREGSKATALKHSFAFSLGMILVFMILATVAVFAGMSWGEQFQNPVFIVVLVSIMFVFGLGMFDLFIILVPNKVAELDQKQDASGFWGNFSKGMLATVLATPCSGPFLGATLAWTLTQEKVVVYVVFLALGLGMASPYILLAASRRLSRIIPKPGAWMETFKQILGFFLFGFAVYLMVGLPRDMVLPTVGMQVALAAAIILYTKIAPFGETIGKKIIGVVVALAVILGGYQINFIKLYESTSEKKAAEHKSNVQWEDFSVEAIQKAHAEGRPVMIDFTANWCMNCQFNKINVYHSAEVEKLIKEKNILVIKADLTTDNKVIESLRNQLGSRSIPFLAIFSGKDTLHPVVMRDIVQKRVVVDQLKSL